MAEREVVLEQPVVMDEQSQALQKATERAEKAEAELGKLKSPGRTSEAVLKSPPTPSSAAAGAPADRQSGVPPQRSPAVLGYRS